MSGVDELDEALAATEAELSRLRAAVRDAREAHVGERLAALAKELAETQAAIAEAEKDNARTEDRVLELREKAKAMRERIGPHRRR